MEEPQFRPLTNAERAILEALVPRGDPATHALAAQLDHAQVKQIDCEESLQFSGDFTDVGSTIISEAKYRDADSMPETQGGPHVNIILHARNQKLWMLEFYKDDGTEILISRPDPTTLEILRLGGRVVDLN
jgi:hypothetical protein